MPYTWVAGFMSLVAQLSSETRNRANLGGAIQNTHIRAAFSPSEIPAILYTSLVFTASAEPVHEEHYFERR